MSLVGRVIASHYAEPVERVVTARSALRMAPTDEAAVIAEVDVGEVFAMLDDSLGWAWGYAGDDRCVGYVQSNALGDQ